MRTDEERIQKVIEDIDKFSIDDLRKHLFNSSLLVEAMVRYLAHPLQSDALPDKWFRAGWCFLKEVRSDEHMDDMVKIVNDLNNQAELVVAEHGSIQ